MHNLLILHEKAYYKDLGIDDPYASSVLEGAACQHLTVETVQSEFGKPKEDSGMRFVIPNAWSRPRLSAIFVTLRCACTIGVRSSATGR